MTTSDATTAELPDVVRDASAQLLGGADDVWFVPVRHHSPGCARALRALLREVRPAAVLVEGPADLDHLVPLVVDEQTRAPVAMLAQSRRAASVRSSFYPLCDYSPEWVALREGAALGARLALVDMPWVDQAWHRTRLPRETPSDAAPPEPDADPGEVPDDAPDDELEVDDPGSPAMVEERYLAHSDYVQAMADRLGCTDHHDLWDRLFELRERDPADDWRGFFHDVFAWCAMARLDYEPQVLEAENSLPRERVMAAHVRRWRQEVEGPVVVVTGGFHTLELVRSWRTARRPRAVKRHDDSWLIRYGFAQLDALGGYASGMPSPGWYQQVWDRTEGGDADPLGASALSVLTRLARSTREHDRADPLSTAHVQAAVAQATRLAALRGNPGPGRQDVVDAARSCFVKGAVDDGTRGLLGDLAVLLGGTAVGDVPPSAGSPPLVEDARRRARAAGVRLDDSTPRTVRLDLYRKERHRDRSRFLHAMSYLGAGLAQWRSGPDFVGGGRQDLLFEEWVAAWTPSVEARLIEVSTDGADVQSACLARLQREEAALSEQGRGRSAAAVVALVVRACLVGLHERLPALLTLLRRHLDDDPSLASVLECGHRLATLWRAREPLGVQGDPQLASLLTRVWPGVLFLLPGVGGVAAADEPAAVKRLLSARELGRVLAEIDPVLVDGTLVEVLHRLADDAATVPGVAGAASALLFVEGVHDEERLTDQVVARFGPGATPSEAVRFLGGLMAAAPELVLRVPALLEGLDGLVRGWDAETFVAALPDLRQAFTGLTPQETADLASGVLRLHDAEGAAPLDQVHATTADDLERGSRLELALAAVLRRDGLGARVAG